MEDDPHIMRGGTLLATNLQAFSPVDHDERGNELAPKCVLCVCFSSPMSEIIEDSGARTLRTAGSCIWHRWVVLSLIGNYYDSYVVRRIYYASVNICRYAAQQLKPPPLPLMSRASARASKVPHCAGAAPLSSY